MYILTGADGFIGKHFKKSLDGVVEVDIDKFSGKLIYIENRAPVARAADQTEDIKLVIEF